MGPGVGDHAFEAGPPLVVGRLASERGDGVDRDPGVVVVESSMGGEHGLETSIGHVTAGHLDVEVSEVGGVDERDDAGLEVSVEDHGGERSGACEPVDMANGMDTEQDVIASLREAGYTHEFFIVEDGVRCPECDSEALAPEAVTIEQIFRFEGESDPDDMSIVFAVTNGPCGLKGVLVSAFGPEVGGPRADILRRLGT